MSYLVTKEAPDFAAQAVMPDNSFEELKLSSYRGKYVVLFFYPLDFTFVCPSEIIAFNKALKQFKDKNAEVIGVSVDSHFSHWAWKNTPVDQGGIRGHGRIHATILATGERRDRLRARCRRRPDALSCAAPTRNRARALRAPPGHVHRRPV